MEIVFAPPTNVKQPVTVELTCDEIEEIMIALSLRMAQLKYEGRAHDVNEIGEAFGKIGEQQFGADPGWWDRNRAFRRLKVTVKPL